MVGFEKAVVDLHQQLYVDRIQPPSFLQIDMEECADFCVWDGVSVSGR